MDYFYYFPIDTLAASGAVQCLSVKRWKLEKENFYSTYMEPDVQLRNHGTVTSGCSMKMSIQIHNRLLNFKDLNADVSRGSILGTDQHTEHELEVTTSYNILCLEIDIHLLAREGKLTKDSSSGPAMVHAATRTKLSCT